MKIQSGRPLACLATALGLVTLVFSLTPLAAEEDPLVEELAAIVTQIEDELTLAGAPQGMIDRCRQAVVDSPATGLDRDAFITRLGDELSSIVEDETALQGHLVVLNDLVGQYLALLEEA